MSIKKGLALSASDAVSNEEHDLLAPLLRKPTLGKLLMKCHLLQRHEFSTLSIASIFRNLKNHSIKPTVLATWISVLSCFFITPVAHAFFIEATDPRFGLNSVTIDTSTNLAWLDINFTDNRSFVDVASQLGPGGDFAGYRYATRAEVLHLFDEFNFISNPILPGVNTNTFFTLFGSTSMQDGHPEALGWASDALTAADNIYGLDFFFSGPTPPFELYHVYRGDTFWQNPNFVFSGTGSWLVQAIPEPSSLGLVSVGILGLLGFAWRSARESHRKNATI